MRVTCDVGLTIYNDVSMILIYFFNFHYFNFNTAEDDKVETSWFIIISLTIKIYIKFYSI